ncbi:MAG TPA: class I SAM-dependent methyltransferase [Verrucomicrobiae bacterium]|nr:class I SAM-dependent methyltransferase [Verrucomicrobiae bacterium]
MDTQPAAERGKIKYGEKRLRKTLSDKSRQAAAEMRVVKKAFQSIPKAHHVLDVPCGNGRVALYLARKGYWVSCAEFLDSMIVVARENFAKNKLECVLDKQGVEHLTYADRSFDTVFSFRHFHHFPTPESRERVVSELCRVAKKYVVLSYMSAASVGSVQRRLKAVMSGRKSSKYATSLAEVKGYFQQADFHLVKDFARAPIVHTLHVAVFERVQ